MVAMARAGPTWSQELFQCLSHGCKCAGNWVAFHCFPKHIGMELYWEYSSWDSNQPLYVIGVVQVAVSLTMPQQPDPKETFLT